MNRKKYIFIFFSLLACSVMSLNTQATEFNARYHVLRYDKIIFWEESGKTLFTADLKPGPKWEISPAAEISKTNWPNFMINVVPADFKKKDSSKNPKDSNPTNIFFSYLHDERPILKTLRPQFPHISLLFQEVSADKDQLKWIIFTEHSAISYRVYKKNGAWLPKTGSPQIDIHNILGLAPNDTKGFMTLFGKGIDQSQGYNLFFSKWVEHIYNVNKPLFYTKGVNGKLQLICVQKVTGSEILNRLHNLVPKPKVIEIPVAPPPGKKLSPGELIAGIPLLYKIGFILFFCFTGMILVLGFYAVKADLNRRKTAKENRYKLSQVVVESQKNDLEKMFKNLYGIVITKHGEITANFDDMRKRIEIYNQKLDSIEGKKTVIELGNVCLESFNKEKEKRDAGRVYSTGQQHLAPKEWIETMIESNKKSIIRENLLIQIFAVFRTLGLDPGQTEDEEKKWEFIQKQLGKEEKKSGALRLLNYERKQAMEEAEQKLKDLNTHLEELEELMPKFWDAQRAVSENLSPDYSEVTAITSFLFFYSVSRLEEAIINNEPLKRNIMIFNIASIAGKMAKAAFLTSERYLRGFESLHRRIKEQLNPINPDTLKYAEDEPHENKDFFQKLLRRLKDLTQQELQMGPFLYDCDKEGRVYRVN